MGSQLNAPQKIHARQYRFLRQALIRLRWITIVALLAITMSQPSTEGVGLAAWQLVLIFAGYNLLVELLRLRLPRLFSFAWLAMLDLPVAGLLYLLAAEAGGPLFVLFVLAIDSAAASMTLRGTVLFTATAAIAAGAIDATFPLWTATPMDIRRLGARLMLLALVGVGMAIVMRRLALEQEAARANRDEAERLEALDQLRNAFIATVSHDLRTPLTATRAGLGLLETSAAERLLPDERELLDAARRNTERLSLQIDDLLALNQLESGTLRLDPQPLDLRSVVMSAVSAVHPLIQEKGQVLELDLPASLRYHGDARRLEQVMVNLLGNAHLHTPAGTRIAIAGRVAEHNILLSVQDDGPGIPVSDQAAIFQRFYRGAAAGEGSGLGLAIVNGIIERHGGRIWVESQPGNGATFCIILPRMVNGGKL